MQTDFPKIGDRYQFLDHTLQHIVSPDLIVHRIIEGGEPLTDSQIMAYYRVHPEIDQYTATRLRLFIRPRVVFFDRVSHRFHVYPWDERTARRLRQRLIPFLRPDPTVIPTTEVKAEHKAAYNKAFESYQIRKGQLEIGELRMWNSSNSTEVSLDSQSNSSVPWSEHAKLKVELESLRATLKRHFPSLKFD